MTATRHVGFLFLVLPDVLAELVLNVVYDEGSSISWHFCPGIIPEGIYPFPAIIRSILLLVIMAFLPINWCVYIYIHTQQSFK